MNAQSQIIRLATVTEVVAGGVKLHFGGELAAREKTYACAGTSPAVNDKVCVMPVSGTYIVLGVLGGAGGGGAGDVTGPAGATAGNLPTFADATGKALADSGLSTNDLARSTGWSALPACTYVSVDDPTGVIDVTGDIRSSMVEGMRIMFTNGGNTICGIITNVNQTLQSGKTRITFLHEIDPTNSQALYLMANGAITNPYYSCMKAPRGFPADPRKWTVQLRYATQTQIDNPVNGTWYNPDSQYLDIPLGAWDVAFAISIDAIRNAGTDLTLYASLSTSSNSESDIDFTAFGVFGVSTTSIRTAMMAHREKFLSLASKMRYYPIMKIGRDDCTVLYQRGGISPLIIRAKCAYL
jgi:hypothetical protein